MTSKVYQRGELPTVVSSQARVIEYSNQLFVLSDLSGYSHSFNPFHAIIYFQCCFSQKKKKITL